MFCSARTRTCRIDTRVDARFLVFAVLLFAAACSRSKPVPIQRLAILRFENLGADSSTDWMGRAFSEVIATELASAPQTYAIPSARLHSLGGTFGIRPIAAPGISAETPLAIAAGANRLAYGQYSVTGGTIRARMTVEDPQMHRMQVLNAVTASAPDVATAATALARQLWANAPDYVTRKPAALAAFSRATEESDPAATEQFARQAIAADPNFGAPYLLLAGLEARQRNRPALMETLQAAAARGTGLPQVDRARLQEIATGLSGDVAARQTALDVLVRLTPNDPAPWRGLAEVASLRHQYAGSVQAYEHALMVEPEDTATWNALAYAAAFAGNLPTAMAALRRYQTLRPTDPNPFDSMGDVNLMSGRLHEAEQFYLQAAKTAPAFLNGADHYKAAVARLMTGDVAGADTLYQQYPEAAIHRAEWLWLSGRRKQGYDMLSGQAAALPNRNAQSIAFAELAIWSLLRKDQAAATAMAEKAVGSATPASAGMVALARFLAAPPLTPAQWEARAQQFFPAPPGTINGSRDLALGYALLLNGNFEPAAAALERAYASSAVTPESGTAVSLGRALVDTGKWQQAAPLLRLNPVPSANGPGPLVALYFPDIFQARAQLAQKQGKADEARANQQLFESLSR